MGYRGYLPMATKGTVKIGPAIDAKLYKELVSVARENGQSQRFLLEKAIEHYLHDVIPSQHLVRPNRPSSVPRRATTQAPRRKPRR